MSDRQVAVVTGGASGIGEAAARRFVEAGWSVVIGDVNEARGHGHRRRTWRAVSVLAARCGLGA